MATFASLPPILHPKEEDIQMMLSAGVHTGTRNSDSSMEGKCSRTLSHFVVTHCIFLTLETLSLLSFISVCWLFDGVLFGLMCWL